MSMKNAKQYLDEIYHQKEQRSEITNLIINGKIEGFLDLSDFINLENLECDFNELSGINLRKNKKLLKINCSNNKIAELNLSNCEKLQSLVCHKNDLVSIDFPNNSINLTYVSCSENNLSDLSIFSGLSGVVKLFIG